MQSQVLCTLQVSAGSCYPLTFHFSSFSLHLLILDGVGSLAGALQTSSGSSERISSESEHFLWENETVAHMRKIMTFATMEQ